MPFKWRLKKTRKYDISSKNLFIVGVYLLDNAYLECTLTAESTGQECLNSIAQRVELAENHYFGLRYVTKKLHFHWVDLEKPLKKQLDKYAQPSTHPHSLYFGVMFYVFGAHKISDEIARYHYYLQLKTDVVDGRLPCSTEQAIRLAAYSLQAEFGDYEPDKYAAEDYLLFPKTMMKDETVAAELLSEAIAGHASLKGVQPLQAELQYVKEVQMMDGYGAEYYSAKDESRKDLYLGTSYAGIFARYADGQSTVYYKWAEIAKVTQNKKSLEIDTPKSSVQFQLEDSYTAKYVSRLAQLQCQFYKSSKGNLSSSLTDISLAEEVGVKPFVDAQPVYIPPPPPTESTNSSQELVYSQISAAHAQEQRYAQEIGQNSLKNLETPESQLYHQQQQHHLHHQQQHHLHHQQQQQPTFEVEPAVGNGMFHQQAMKHESVTPVPEGDPVYVNRAALLPAYRPSPDYDAVMQHRMMQQHQQHLQPHFDEITPHLGAAQVYVHPDGMAYSQPEISQNMSSYKDEHGNYANVDALRNYSHSIYANIFQEGHGFYPGRGSERTNNLAVHPTYSSPELNTKLHQPESYANNEFSTQEPLTYHFRPPPPYPRTSSSTPDLAVQANSSLMSDQPDLVLPALVERAGLRDLLIQSQLDTSVEDLSTYQMSGATFSIGGTQMPIDLRHVAGHVVIPSDFVNKVEPISSTEVANSETKDNNKTLEIVQGAGESRHNESDLTFERESANKVLSDDADDTSSEHSYSTFHAKESDDSSEEDAAKPKSSLAKNESKIQIRMFTAQQAPPPSKIKEEATLRESFRRMKIAQTGSVSKEASGIRRSSLCGLKEASESTNQTITTAQPAVPQFQNTHPSLSSAHTTSVSSDTFSTPEMEEILEQLGDPPPYPKKSTKPDLVLNISAPLDKVPPKTSNNHYQNNQLTVKRSNSVGMVPSKHAPFIPPRKDPPSSKLRTANFNLDMVVPVSKPGIIKFNKEPDTSTSVLKTESNICLAGESEGGDSVKEVGSTGEKEFGHEGRDDISDNLSSLQDYSVASDSDSDHEQNTGNSQLNMGPLKLAAMNGLTLSRSVVLSLMNDESRAPTDDRRKMLESKISEGQVYAEFEQIPRKSESLECNVAKAAHNALRNRFKDVLPYDITRVKLTPGKDNPDGYINASHMKLTANDTKWLFIATQAPLSNTAVDFWQMMWESSVDVIAMLTPFQELGKSKCFVYWPQEPGGQHKQIYGEFEVELQFTDDSLCYLTSRIILRHGNQEHKVWHLQYTDWPDHGCPEDMYGFLGFLDEIESVARLAENETGRDEKSPVVVHCSAGVGRTGVVILTMVMKWCLEHNHNVDLPKALSGIRNQRMHMVQTMGQYRFIHDTLIQYLKNTRLI